MTVGVSVAETGNLNIKSKCASPVGTMAKENSTGDVGDRSDHGQILEEDRNMFFFNLETKTKMLIKFFQYMWQSYFFPFLFFLFFIW